jgi:hypothetical protein
MQNGKESALSDSGALCEHTKRSASDGQWIVDHAWAYWACNRQGGGGGPAADLSSDCRSTFNLKKRLRAWCLAPPCMAQGGGGGGPAMRA